MHEALCPPCGTVIRAATEDELVAGVQAHAKQFHGHDPTREEVLQVSRRVDQTAT
jgi:predicted small metal-binding protein